jgi:prepilin-type N-terminal cleavage/methylation domain-containing protein
MPALDTVRFHNIKRGFGLVELAVALAVLSALLYFLLDRVLYMQERAEKTEVEETVRSINYALRLEAASRLARGPEPSRPPLEKENPVKWLQTPPRNYLGEMEDPPAHAKPAYWYFDPVRRQLVYRPNRSDHLTVEGARKKELRFVVGIGGDLPHPRLISHISYEWF